MTDKQRKKLDKRVYTFMFIPHRGVKTRSFSLPIVTIKRIGLAFFCALLIFGGVQFKHMLTVWQAQAEQEELTQLRANKESQEEKVSNLARLTQEMQEEMQKVTQLEGEVRRSLGAEGAANVSRSAAGRGGLRQAQFMAAIDYTDVDELTRRVREINDFARQKQASLAELDAKLKERNARRAATPSIWPAYGEITSRFGLRNSPSGMGSSMHKGLDIAGRYGSPVVATADGVVEIASYYYGYGLYVQINHGYGLQTAYGHNSALAVNVGEKVKKGQIIAYMGNSGVSTGTHLHYEVIRNGVQVDPANFL
ncbi:MAG: M23 family metallopeptidase [Acidaminococcales bacterium]|nr:M23 family metallopeptidase [Acidaminococcales bacterium]